MNDLGSDIFMFNGDLYNYMFQYPTPDLYLVQHPYPIYLKLNADHLVEKIYPQNPLTSAYPFYDSLIYTNSYLSKIIRKYNFPSNYPYLYNTTVVKNNITHLDFSDDSVTHITFDGDIVYTGNYQFEYDTTISTISLKNYGFSFLGNSNTNLLKKVTGISHCTDIFYGVWVDEEYRYTFDQYSRVQSIKILGSHSSYKDSITFTYY